VKVIGKLAFDGTAKPGTGVGIATIVVPALIGSKAVCLVHRRAERSPGVPRGAAKTL
jgi:hypothetical protein